MTVQNENFRNDYDGNDATTVFPVTYRFLANDQLDVFITESDGTVVDQILDTDYTVTGAGDASGGDVTMVVAPATGEQLSILREVPLTQLIDYIENDNFPAESHETGLDKLTMIAQEQAEEVGRTFKLGESYDADDYDVELVPASDEFLVWNAAGDKIISIPFLDIDDYIQVEKLYNSGAVVLDTSADGIFLPLGAANINEFSTDGTLAGDSDTALPTEKAVKTFCDAMVLTVADDNLSTTTVLLNSQELYIGTGTAGIFTLIAPQGLGIFLDFAVVVDVDGVQAVSNKTFTDCTWASGAISFDEVVLADNKAIIFGDGPDAQMFSDGTTLMITDGGQIDTLMTFPVGAGPRLYYNAKETLRVISSGIQLTDWTTSETSVIHMFLTNLTIQSDSPGRPVLITARNTADDDQHSLLVGDPDGSFDLYYAGDRVLETYAAGGVGGFTIRDTANVFSGRMHVAGVDGSMFIVDEGDIAFKYDVTLRRAELFYEDTKRIATHANGMTVYDSIGQGSGVYMSGGVTYIVAGYTGGKLTFQGTTTGDVVTDLLKGDPEGAVELYYAGDKVAYTRAGGLFLYNAGDIGSVNIAASLLHLTNTVNGGGVSLDGKTTGGVVTDLLIGDPDGRVDLYYAGDKVFGTYAAGGVGGFTIYDTANVFSGRMHIGGVDGSMFIVDEGDIAFKYDVTLRRSEMFYQDAVRIATANLGMSIYDNVGQLTSIFVSGGYTYMDAVYTGGKIRLRGTTTGDVIKDLFTGDPENKVELFYAGLRSLETSALGILIYESGGDRFYISMTASKTYIVSEFTGANMLFRAANDLDVVTTVIEADPDGGVELFHAGGLRLATTATGITVPGAHLDDDDFISFGDGPDGRIFSDGTDLKLAKGDGLETFIRMIPDGAVHLYHDGVYKMKTHANGIEVDGARGIRLDTVAGMVEHYGPAAGWAMGSRFWGSGSTELGSMGMLGTSDTATYFYIGEDFNVNLILKGIPGGAVELYHNGLIALKTDASGVLVRDTSGGTPALWFQSSAEAYLSGIIVGSGAPEGVRTATVGSLYLRTDGGAGTSLYVKESGSGTTGWVAK